MGDPTLRMAVVKPPTAVYTSVNGNSDAVVQWTSSQDASVLGYRVYWLNRSTGRYDKVSGTGNVQGGQFIDADCEFNSSGDMTSVYMVRAVKLEQGNTGTYFNLSQGAFSETLSGLVVGVGRQSRAHVGSFALTFNRPVDLGDSGVYVTRRTAAGQSSPLNISIYSDDDGLSYVITLLEENGGEVMFGDGIYDIQVIPSEITLAGTATPLTDLDHAYMFFRLAGDADGDGGVSINDFNILSSSFGTDHNLDADSDDDGSISINDFNEMATNFGTTVWNSV